MYTIKKISELTGVPKSTIQNYILDRGMNGRCYTKKNTRYFTEEQFKIIAAKIITLYRVIKKPKKQYFEFAGHEYKTVCSEINSVSGF